MISLRSKRLSSDLTGEVPGTPPGSSMASLYRQRSCLVKPHQWVIIRETRRYPDWFNVERNTAFANVPMV